MWYQKKLEKQNFIIGEAVMTRHNTSGLSSS